MFPTGVIHDRIRNPACLAVPPVEAVSADRELSAGQLQSRFGALFGRLDQRTEQQVGDRVEPTVHRNHVCVDDARIGCENADALAGDPLAQFERE